MCVYLYNAMFIVAHFTVHQVTGLEDRLSEAMLLEYELEETTHTPHVCFSYRKSVDVHDAICDREANLMSEVENDEPLLLSEAKVVKLDGGGSLYSSSMSINKVCFLAAEIAFFSLCSLSLAFQ